MASARYCHGDHFTQADYDTLAALPRDPGGQVLARSLADRLDHPVCCVPANTLTVDHATTIGLGDTFIGGFIAALPTTSISNTPTSQPVITECPSVRDAYPSHTG
jgi:ADP-dependent phosphofructokinase/glucokinase